MGAGGRPSASASPVGCAPQAKGPDVEPTKLQFRSPRKFTGAQLREIFEVYGSVLEALMVGKMAHVTLASRDAARMAAEGAQTLKEAHNLDLLKDEGLGAFLTGRAF